MSEFKLSGRKVDFFRCHIDPSIGPKPKNAFKCSDMKMTAELTPIGIYVNYPENNENGYAESIVPYPNVQSIKLLPADNVLPLKKK